MMSDYRCAKWLPRQLNYQLGLFERYTDDRPKFFPDEIMPDDVIEFSAI